ncbi:MAG: hypothetical protein AAGD38_12750 [Acidobacteriota bacterium]
MSRFFFLLLLLFPVLPVFGSFDEVEAIFPDTCTSTYTPGVVASDPVPGVDGTVIAYWTAGSFVENQVVLIVNGNSFGEPDYVDLAEHLAQNGFIAVVAIRPDGVDPVDFVFTALEGTFDWLGIDPDGDDYGLALVGHSVGGGVVVDAAVANDDNGMGYSIGGVANLAPVASSEHLDESDTPSFLVIYGSQDEDVDGFNGLTPAEAHAAYDNAGTESTTTCNNPPCLDTRPGLERTMVFVYGADHAGLVGKDTHFAWGGEPQDLEYVSGADQLCIVKAYLTGFLRYRLYDIEVYRGLLRGEWQPVSVDAITTNKADFFGNPAGSDMRLFVQASPAERKVIQNFEFDLGAVTLGPGVVAQHLDNASFNAPFHIRHRTAHAAVGWEADVDTVPWIRWDVPSISQDASSYTHVSIRLGQLEGIPAPNANPFGADQRLWIGVEDHLGQIYWHWIDDVPPPDVYLDPPSPRARSGMHTERIHTEMLDRVIDIGHVIGVYLAFPESSTGSLIVDSIEWHRDGV